MEKGKEKALPGPKTAPISEETKTSNGVIKSKKGPKGLVGVKGSSGSLYLDRVRAEIMKAYTPEYIQKKIGDLCDAEDIRVSKGEEIRTPNWRAREGGLRMIMQIQGIDEANIFSEVDGKETKDRKAPTNITINIVNPTPESIDVKKPDVIDVPSTETINEH